MPATVKQLSAVNDGQYSSIINNLMYYWVETLMVGTKV